MKNLSKILRTETEAICHPKGRMVGSDGHERAKVHLKRRLEEMGCKPYVGRSLELTYPFKGKIFLQPGRPHSRRESSTPTTPLSWKCLT